MFLYFTKKDNKTNKIKAAYTGRFAFISDKLIYEDIEKTFTAISAEERKEIEFQKYEEIQEEFLHHVIFQKNISSLFINGFRYITRLIWRLFENKKIVKLYYEYRTLFFFIMYAPQEMIVEKLKRTQQYTINKTLFFLLIKYDIKYIKLLIKYEKNKNLITFFILLIISPVLITIGYVITKFFTIILYEKDKNNNIYQHKYIAKNRIVKDLNRKKTISSKIGELIQFERIIQKINNFDEQSQNIKWMIIKFKSEKYIYEYISKHKNKLINNKFITKKIFDKNIFDNFDEYLYKIVLLSFIWADINPNKNNRLFYKFMVKLYKAINNNENLGLEKMINDNPELNRVVEFFYMHGN